MYEDFLSGFKYDENSASKLAHATNKYKGRKYSVLACLAGDFVGSKNKYGYWRVYVCRSGNRQSIAIHRIIWELFNGPIPEGMEIDHINKNPSDNEISNLRMVTPEVNMHNRGMLPNNTSGFTGVKLNRKKYKDDYHDYWLAKVSVNKKEKVKHFSIRALGYDKAFEMACQWRLDQIEELNLSGAGYTESHGM